MNLLLRIAAFVILVIPPANASNRYLCGMKFSMKEKLGDIWVSPQTLIPAPSVQSRWDRIRHFKTDTDLGGFNLQMHARPRPFGIRTFHLANEKYLTISMPKLSNLVPLGSPSFRTMQDGMKLQTFPAAAGLRIESGNPDKVSAIVFVNGLTHILDFESLSSLTPHPGEFVWNESPEKRTLVDTEEWRIFPLKTLGVEASEIHFAVLRSTPLSKLEETQQLADASIWVVQVSPGNSSSPVKVYPSPLCIEKTGLISDIQYKSERVLSVSSSDQITLINAGYGTKPVYKFGLVPNREDKLALSGW